MNMKEIERKLRKRLIAWINKHDVNYGLADEHHLQGWTVDVEDLLKQVNLQSIVNE